MFSLDQWISEEVLRHPRRKTRYCVRIRWAVIGGRMEPVEIKIGTAQPKEEPLDDATAKARAAMPEFWAPTEPVLLTDLREIGLQKLIDRERTNGGKAYLDYVKTHGKPPGPEEAGGWTLEALNAHAAAPFVEPARKGPDVAPDEYREAAEVYQRAWAAGLNPRQAVADRFGISPDAAAKRVQRARDRGLLPKTRRGRAAATPTPRKRGSR